MRISRLLGLIAAASVLAACGGQNSGVIGHPGTTGNNLIRQSSHALVAPGVAGRMAILSGAPRLIGSGVHHDFKATRPCTYLSENLSGDVKVYNGNLTLAGDFASTTYGWGALAVKSGTSGKIYLGRNDATGSLDIYTACTNTMIGSVTGAGGYPYGIAGFSAAGKPGYATDWPTNSIEYWATGTGTAVLKTDANQSESYFLDFDKHNKLWVSGYSASTGDEIVDRCNKIVTICKTMVDIPSGFPGGVQVDSNDQLYVNNQYGTLTSYNCSSLTSCTLTATFTYSNGTNPLDYTAIALDPLAKHLIWGANIYYCTDSCTDGIATDGQSQTLPLSSAVLGAATPGTDNAEFLGIARFLPDSP